MIAKIAKKGSSVLAVLLALAMMVACLTACDTEDVLDEVGLDSGILDDLGQKTYGVGDTAEVKDVKVTFVGITESEGITYLEPEDGNIYVLCEFEIENNSSKELSVSSMLSFDAYCDDYSCTISLGALSAKGRA